MREAPHALRSELERALGARDFALSHRSGLTNPSERLGRDDHRRAGSEGVTIISTKNTGKLLRASSPHYARVLAYVGGLMGGVPDLSGVILREQHSGVWANGNAVRTGQYYLILPRTVVYLTDMFTAGQVDGDIDALLGVVARVVVPGVERVAELSVGRMFNLAVAGPQTAKLVQLSDLAFMLTLLPNVRDSENHDEITLLRMKSLRP